MKLPRSLLALSFVLLCSCGKEKPAFQFDPAAAIDPAHSICGLPLGFTEQQFIEACGQPIGRIQLKGGESALIYSASRAFRFTGNRLSGVWIDDPLVTSGLSSLFPTNVFDDRNWRLANGVTNRMRLTALKSIVGEDRLRGTPPYMQYSTDGAQVDLEFIYEADRSGDDAYAVFKIQTKR